MLEGVKHTSEWSGLIGKRRSSQNRWNRFTRVVVAIGLVILAISKLISAVAELIKVLLR